jgi:cytochrome b561
MAMPASRPLGEAARETRLRHPWPLLALHWVMAAGLLGTLVLGWSLNHLVPEHTARQAQLLTLHVSIGLSLLALALLRVAIRGFGGRAPPSFEEPTWERRAASATQGALYGLMFALPLTGWTMASARAPPVRFWSLPWPKLPGLRFMTGPEHLALRHGLKLVHADLLVWLLVALVALHVAGAVRRQRDGRPVLWRMLPWTKPRG